MKMLPVVFRGNNSNIKVIVAANIKMCSILFHLAKNSNVEGVMQTNDYIKDN